MNVARPQVPIIPICPLFKMAKMMNSTVVASEAAKEEGCNCLGKRCGFWSVAAIDLPNGTQQVLESCGFKQGPAMLMGLLTQVTELTNVQAITAGILPKPEQAKE